MKRQLWNAAYGLLDYAAYPIGMLAVAPFILRKLGAAQYGVWAVTASVVNLGSMLASGFGDANTQRVAGRLSPGGTQGVARTVKAAMGIHLALGFAAAIAIWCFASSLAHRLALHDPDLENTCLWCIRIAAVLTVIRALETVCVSTQKAYQRYGAAVRASVLGRVVSIAAAAVLAAKGRNVTTIMTVTAAMMTAALAVQMIGLQRLIGTSIGPSYEGYISRDLMRFGAFTWILTAAGVVFAQADRLLGGASLGAAGIVSYALCAQLSQPVYGLTAAGLHFLFPYIVSRRTDKKTNALKKTLLVAGGANVLIVLAGAGFLLIFSDQLLHLLATEELAHTGMQLLPWVLAGSTLLALSVTGSYAMVALGNVRTVAALSVAACIALAFFTIGALADRGLIAIAQGRIAFALVTLCVYIPLFKEVRILTPKIKQIAPGELAEEA